MTKAEHVSLIQHAIQTHGFLIERGTTVTFAEFACAVRAYSNDPRALAIANALDMVDGVVTHAHTGFSAEWSYA